MKKTIQVKICVFLSASFRVSIRVLPLLLLILSTTARVNAAEKLILSVTPPLFQLTIGPGEFWASSLKVVNANNYDLTVFASVMNFEAKGETGQGKLIPITEIDPEALPHTLAGWIEVTHDPIFIPREKSTEVPFSVRIPKDASPGGHYAAILIGTKPVLDSKEGSVIEVSSMVSSLFFVRISGEVREDGDIREFSTGKNFYQRPEIDLTLRFENKGNVHLQPRGEIIIYNMWGKERGRIPINQKSAFGNILPHSIRKFIYEWRGESNFFEIGKYRAVVTLTFGQEAKQNVFSKTSFWVIPIKSTFTVLGSFIFLILFIVWAIRVYIQRALALAQKHYGMLSSPVPTHSQWTFLAQPVKEGIIDLRNVRLRKRERGDTQKKEILVLAHRYYIFFISLLVVIVGILWLVVYFQNVLTRTRSFEVIVPREEEKQILP